MSLSPATRKATYGGKLGEAVAKGERAKPGKRAPTVLERDWMDRITAFGCIACWLDGRRHQPAAVHHILRGGVRMGHLYTLPLCDPGHHQNGRQIGLVSRHPWKARFEAGYGTEWELLALARDEIGIERLSAESKAVEREIARALDRLKGQA